MAVIQRKHSESNKNMLEAEGATPINGLPPGMGLSEGDISFEELGKLSEFPDSLEVDNPEEGTGDFIVVLSDTLTGVEDESFKKGDVRRLSRVIMGFEKPEIDRDFIKGRIKRLFALKAIRMASSEEVTMARKNGGAIEVIPENETNEVHVERNRRFALEQENERLRRSLQMAEAAQQQATPGKAGSSEQAQTAAAAQNDPAKTDGKTETDSWE